MGPRPICRTEHERPAPRTPAARRRVWTDGGERGYQWPRPWRRLPLLALRQPAPAIVSYGREDKGAFNAALRGFHGGPLAPAN